MMGERPVMQESLFYEFRLEDHVPCDHLLRRIDRFVDCSELRQTGKSAGRRVVCRSVPRRGDGQLPGRAVALRLLEDPPDGLRRGRHIDVAHAAARDCVDHRIHHRRQ